MANLPKGVPVYENVQAARYEAPAILGLLRDSAFSGYATFTFFETLAILLFDEGKLVDLHVETRAGKLNGLEGVTRLFDLIATEGGRLDVYRLTPSLVRALLGYLRGTQLHEAQALKLLDRKALLENVRSLRLTGALHIYTASRSSMIFYREGIPLGFFHDGSEAMETAGGEFQSIAALPDAMIDVARTVDVDEGALLDLLEMVNVEKVWQATLGRHAARREDLDRQEVERQRLAREGTAADMESVVADIGTTFLGKLGRTLVEREIAARGGRLALLDPPTGQAFLAGVEKGARLLTSASRTTEMLEALRAEMASRATYDDGS